jgi:hypothetical protein
MANKTDVAAYHTHGTDPQYLIEKITREKIYDSNYCMNSYRDSSSSRSWPHQPSAEAQAPQPQPPHR